MQKIPVKNLNFFHRIKDDGIVQLISIEEDAHYWEIDGVAFDLWKSIDGKLSWTDIKAMHLANSDIPKQDFEKNADALLEELVTNKIVLLK